MLHIKKISKIYPKTIIIIKIVQITMNKHRLKSIFILHIWHLISYCRTRLYWYIIRLLGRFLTSETVFKQLIGKQWNFKFPTIPFCETMAKKIAQAQRDWQWSSLAGLFVQRSDKWQMWKLAKVIPVCGSNILFVLIYSYATSWL